MTKNALAPLDTLQRYSVPEASAYLRQSRAKTYQDINSGTLPIIKDGRRTYIPGTAIADRSRVDPKAA
jgi:excisionase family DNA binding protein